MPANQIMGLAPGEVFVHRNIANVVVHTDLNCLSVIQFAVDVLQGRSTSWSSAITVAAACMPALTGTRVGLADNWIRHVGDVAQKHARAAGGDRAGRCAATACANST